LKTYMITSTLMSEIIAVVVNIWHMGALYNANLIWEKLVQFFAQLKMKIRVFNNISNHSAIKSIMTSQEKTINFYSNKFIRSGGERATIMLGRVPSPLLML